MDECMNPRVGVDSTPEGGQDVAGLRAGPGERPIRWQIPRELTESAGIAGRNASAAKIARMPIDDAARLNGSLTPVAMAGLVGAAARHLLDEPLRGVGIELGAGMGILSSTVAAADAVDTVLSVDVCENFASMVITAVADEMLGPDRAGKVVPVHGSFDCLKLPDGRLDFAVEIGAFHHSDDLATTVTETARVLRSGASLVCFDRAHPDALTDAEVDRMLDRTYTVEWLEENGYPPDVVLTRRENGEHEYRFREWQQAFDRAGLQLVRRVLFADDLTWRNALKAVPGILPARVHGRLVRRPVSTSYAGAWLLDRLRRDGEEFPGIVRNNAGMYGFLLRKP